MDGSELLVDRPGPGVAVLTLNRPAVRDAIGWRAWELPGAAIGELAEDDTCRTVVLSGAGGAVPAGGHVTTSPSRGAGLGAPAARSRTGQRVLENLLTLPEPVLAAVEGPAMGIGWSRALSCEVVVAARSPMFGAPFVLRGLVPGGATAWALTRGRRPVRRSSPCRACRGPADGRGANDREVRRCARRRSTW